MVAYLFSRYDGHLSHVLHALMSHRVPQHYARYQHRNLRCLPLHNPCRRSSSLDRAGSLGLPAGLDGLTVAQGMFGTILSALKKFSLDDPSAGCGAYGGSSGGLNGGVRRGSDAGSSGAEHSGSKAAGAGGGHLHHHRQLSGSGAGGNGRQQLHLFSSAWSYSKWHNGGEPHPRCVCVCGVPGGPLAWQAAAGVGGVLVLGGGASWCSQGGPASCVGAASEVVQVTAGRR